MLALVWVWYLDAEIKTEIHYVCGSYWWFFPGISYGSFYLLVRKYYLLILVL